MRACMRARTCINWNDRYNRRHYETHFNARVSNATQDNQRCITIFRQCSVLVNGVRSAAS